MRNPVSHLKRSDDRLRLSSWLNLACLLVSRLDRQRSGDSVASASRGAAGDAEGWQLHLGAGEVAAAGGHLSHHSAAVRSARLEPHKGQGEGQGGQMVHPRASRYVLTCFAGIQGDSRRVSTAS